MYQQYCINLNNLLLRIHIREFSVSLSIKGFTLVFCSDVMFIAQETKSVQYIYSDFLHCKNTILEASMNTLLLCFEKTSVALKRLSERDKSHGLYMA